MRTEQSINWSQAQEVTEEKQQAQQKAIDEYLESNHESTDARDLIHYLSETGKSIEWLIENGRNLSPLLVEPLKEGCSLDDLLHVDPTAHIGEDDEDDEDDEPALTLCDGKVLVFFIQYCTGSYYIHVADRMHNGQCYPDLDTEYEDLEECGSVPHSKFIDFAKQIGII